MPPAPDNNNASSTIKTQLTQQGYDFVALLGKGGSGVVWLAEDKRLDRKVAIKLLHTNSETQNHIAEEARLLAKFNHPGVVQIYDILSVEDEQNARHFAIVMEYIEGRDLLSWQREKMPDTDTKLSVLLQLSQTLAYIHQQDIVHGDLKPANILMRGQQPVITDFGEALAKAKRDKQAMRTTQSWSAPEVQASGILSTASDAYSFALVAVWLLSHWHPGEANARFNLDEQAHQQFLQQFDSISQGFPEGMALLLGKLLTWQASVRLNNFSLIALELEQITRLSQQQTPLNQNTELLEAVTDQPKPLTPEPNAEALSAKTWWLAGLALLLVVAISAGTFLYKQTPKTRFIALLPPEVTGSLDANREQLLASAVSHAIENNIINNKDFLLIPSSDIRGVIRQAKEQEDGPLNLTRIVGNAMGATDVISIALDCAITHCDVALSRSEKSTTTKPEETATWATSLSDRFSTPLVENLRFSDAISQRFPRLFELEDAAYSETDNISEEAYSRYLEIVRSFRENEGGGDLDGLLEELEALIEAHPDFYSWYWLYRRVAITAFHHSKNRNYLERAQKLIKNAPNNYQNTLNILIDYFWLNLTLKEFNNSESNLKELANLNLQPVLQLYFRALLSFAKQDFEASIESMEQLRVYNKSSDLLHNLALSYWYIGNTKKSIPIIREAISINPYLIELKQLMGTALLISGSLEEASTIYEQILEYVVNSTDLSNLSVIKVLQKKYLEAKSYAEKALEISPLSPDLHLNLADILKLTGDPDSAELHYKEALNLIGDKRDFQSRLVSVQAISHLGDIDSAIKEIESIKKDFPSNGYAFFTASLVFALIERPNLSIFHLNQSLNLGFDSVWFTLPWFDFICESSMYRKEIDTRYLSSICPALDT